MGLCDVTCVTGRAGSEEREMHAWGHEGCVCVDRD